MIDRRFSVSEKRTFGLNNFCSVYGVDEPYFLSVSKRCPSAICLFAEEIAAQIPPVPGLTKRPPLQPDRNLPEGRVSVISFPSTIAETRSVHAQIAELLRNGVPSTEIMVIAPFSADVYIDFLNHAANSDRADIKYFDTRESNPATSSTEFRALYAFARVAIDQNDHLALRALLALAHGYGPTFVRKVMTAAATSFAAALRGLAPLDDAAGRFMASVNQTLDAMRAAEAWQEAVDAVDTWLRWVGGRDARSWDFLRIDNQIVEFMNNTSPQAQDETLNFAPLGELLQGISSSQRGDRPPGASEVPVYTVHQAKGMQADYVFIIGAFTRAFTDQGAHLADGIRRLYVAVTRPKRELRISVGRSIRAANNPLARQVGANFVDLTPHVAEAATRVGIPLDRR
jgi:superfamily I DNA/RNA helicase